MAKTGRPKGSGIIYGQEVREQILQRLAQGETLRAICRSEGMPTPSLVTQWVDAEPDFATRYARARRDGLEVMAEQTVDISDDQSLDPAARRVMVDTRKWLLSKMRPDKYGDAVKVEHSGSVSIAQEILAKRKARQEQAE